jgi:hypothetical protein
MDPRQEAFSHTQIIDITETILQHGERLGFKLSIPSESSLDTPLIVLLGWLGCQVNTYFLKSFQHFDLAADSLPKDKYAKRKNSSVLLTFISTFSSQDRFLCKYSDFLENAAYPTLRAICPPPAVMAPHPAPRRNLAKAILQFISVIDEGDMSRPIIFYVFSNGGAFILEQIDSLLADRNPNDNLMPLQPKIIKAKGATSTSQSEWFNVQGVIFDSAPCYMHFSVGARALGEGKSLPLKIFFALAFAVSTLISFVIHPFWPQRYWKHMNELSENVGNASLYLYSEDDPLCDYKLLKQLIETRQAQAAAAARSNRIVKAHCWEKSMHVGHLRCHQQEYMRLILDFIEEITIDKKK